MTGIHRSPGARPYERWRLRRAEVLAILGFWTLFAVLTIANRLLSASGGGFRVPPEATVTLGFATSYLWALLTPPIFWLTWRFGGERAGWAARVAVFAGAGVAVAALVSIAGTLLWVHVFHLPPFPGSTGSVLRSVVRPWFVNDMVIYTGVLAAGFAREYFLRYQVRLEEAVRLQAHAAQLQAQLADARLETLRMQLNPHFLFNTLHAVSSLVERDPRGVRRMIARLSELLRHTLSGSGEQEVPLEQELEFLQRYLEILQVRFQGHLEVETRVEPELRGALVPNLILQPLVENAAKHGVAHTVGVSRIEITARREADRLVLGVRDNGPGLRADAPQEGGAGVGLRNVRARLAQLYGDDQELVLQGAPDGGVLAEVRLPFHTRADLRASDLSAAPAGSGHER